MRTLVWVCVCSTSAALVPFELFGVPRRTAQLGSAGSDTSLPKIVTSAAASTLYNLFVLTEEGRPSLKKESRKIVIDSRSPVIEPRHPASR